MTLAKSIGIRLPKPVVQFFFKGHERSLKAKANIIASLFLKGMSILINLALVPITLNYLNADNYGIWLTLSSLIGWFVFFDIGLGNGLRNKFAEALAKNDKETARVYVSTTYAILSVISIVLFLLFVLANKFLDWSKILNSAPETANELSLLVIIVFGFFCLRFIFQLINTILTADQKPALSIFIKFVSDLLSLIIIYVLSKTTKGSLLYLGTTVSCTSVFILATANVVFFSKSYREFIPTIKYVRFKYAKELTSLGFHFFIIQIAAIVLFSTDNMIITQLYGPSEVTPYNIAYKYFGIILLIFSIVVQPFWSACTDAYHKNDLNWIRNIVKQLIRGWTGIVLVVLCMLLLSNGVYQLWIGNKVRVPFFLSASMGLFVIIYCWTYIFVSFINGVGTIRLQLYNSIFVSVLNVPLSIFLAKYINLGVIGVILATCICISIGAVWAPIQYLKIMNNKAKGLWAR